MDSGHFAGRSSITSGPLKVVLFCGGMGLRLREYPERVPKPMVPVGPEPILRHLMRYYAHHGHSDFIICLGHQGQVIRDYLAGAGARAAESYSLPRGNDVQVFRHPIEGWTASCVETGLSANIGERLRQVRPLLLEDDAFLANYSDVLSDVPLPLIVSQLDKPGTIAATLCVRPTYSCHVMVWDDDSTRVTDIADMTRSSMWLNGGFFAFRREIFDYLGPGEELVEKPFQRLIAEGALAGVRYEGFWAPMDTFKEKNKFDEMYERGERPWCVWADKALAG
jgi:glucose-1-phosphate cytidylyltransferase